MDKVKVTVWDIQDYLKTPDDMYEYLQAAIEENDVEYALIAAYDVVKACKKMGLDYGDIRTGRKRFAKIKKMAASANKKDRGLFTLWRTLCLAAGRHKK